MTMNFLFLTVFCLCCLLLVLVTGIPQEDISVQPAPFVLIRFTGVPKENLSKFEKKLYNKRGRYFSLKRPTIKETQVQEPDPRSKDSEERVNAINFNNNVAIEQYPIVNPSDIDYSTNVASEQYPALTTTGITYGTNIASEQHPRVTTSGINYITNVGSEQHPKLTTSGIDYSINVASEQHPTLTTSGIDYSTNVASEQHPSVTTSSINYSTNVSSEQHPRAHTPDITYSTNVGSEQLPGEKLQYKSESPFFDGPLPRSNFSPKIHKGLGFPSGGYNLNKYFGSFPAFGYFNLDTRKFTED